VIAKSFALTGQETPTAGQSESLTSVNNFINFCALTLSTKPITNGLQTKTGSCNVTPMGIIAATTNMPSTKFVFPTNFGAVQANAPFTIQVAVKNIQLGTFTNAQLKYYAAPQTVNAQGNIIGHTHVTVEKLTSLDQTTPMDPNVFAFFKGINTPQDGSGVATADVTAGLPAGDYRLCTINSSANHQPVLVAVAQHGWLDDCVYVRIDIYFYHCAPCADDLTCSSPPPLTASPPRPRLSQPAPCRPPRPCLAPLLPPPPRPLLLRLRPPSPPPPPCLRPPSPVRAAPRPSLPPPPAPPLPLPPCRLLLPPRPPLRAARVARAALPPRLLPLP
jgi:hypothetical protein